MQGTKPWVIFASGWHISDGETTAPTCTVGAVLRYSGAATFLCFDSYADLGYTIRGAERGSSARWDLWGGGRRETGCPTPTAQQSSSQLAAPPRVKA